MPDRDVTLDIMVPFWGDPELLYATVRSVQAQTSDDWRLTVVDDVYPDPSVAEHFAAVDDPRVRYVRNEENLGITGNFQRCADLAEHERVVLLGCDDLLLPRYVEVVLDAHRRRPDADIIQPGVRVVDETGAPSLGLSDRVKRVVTPRARAGQERLVGGEPLAAGLLQGNWLYWPSLAFRRDRLVATRFREGFPVIQDLALVLDMVLDGAQVLVVPEECFVYRRHSSSASMERLADGSRFDGERDFFRHAERLTREAGWPRAARAARQHLLSRAYAASLLPGALLGRRREAARVLARHTFGRLGTATRRATGDGGA